MLFYGVQEGRLGGEQWQTGLYFRSTQLDLEGARNVWSATMQNLFTIAPPSASAYTSLMGTVDSVDNSHVYQVSESTDLKVARSNESIGTAPGTSPGTVPPRHDSLLVLLYPAVRTRAIGRMYLPRVTASFIQGGDLHPSFAPGIKACVNQAFAFLAANSGTPVIRNRRRHTDQPAVAWVLSTRLASSSTRTPDSHPTYL